MTFSFSFSHMFLYLPLYYDCYLTESLENGKWCAGGFPVRLPFFHCSYCMCRIITLQSPFILSQRKEIIFCPIMIFSSCYDIICFNFNLNVMDVRGLLN